MTFKIFKKTGELRDRNDDWDGDEGYKVEIEVPDEKVHSDFTCIVYNAFFKAIETQYTAQYREHYMRRIKQLFNVLDCWDKVQEEFAEELQSKYEEEYADG